jgi:hypothetical protein
VPTRPGIGLAPRYRLTFLGDVRVHPSILPDCVIGSSAKGGVLRTLSRATP